MTDPTEQEEQIAAAVDAGVARQKTDVLIKAEKTIRLREMQRISAAASREGVTLHMAVWEKDAKPMSIRFLCPQCGKKLKAPDRDGGRQTLCTGCGHKGRDSRMADGSTAEVATGPGEDRGRARRLGRRRMRSIRSA